MNLKQKLKELKSKTSQIYLAMKHQDTPLLAKIMASITIIYALSPIDLIPDFIPILGYLDDLIILPLLITLTIKLIPINILEVCEEEAKLIWKDGKPKKWYYSIPIIIIWLLTISIILYMILK